MDDLKLTTVCQWQQLKVGVVQLRKCSGISWPALNLFYWEKSRMKAGNRSFEVSISYRASESLDLLDSWGYNEGGLYAGTVFNRHATVCSI